MWDGVRPILWMSDVKTFCPSVGWGSAKERREPASLGGGRSAGEGKWGAAREGATEGPAHICSLLQDHSKSPWPPSRQSRGSLITPILWMTAWGKRVAPWFRVTSPLVIELSTWKMHSRLFLWMWMAKVISACPQGLWFAEEACSGQFSPVLWPHGGLQWAFLTRSLTPRRPAVGISHPFSDPMVACSGHFSPILWPPGGTCRQVS